MDDREKIVSLTLVAENSSAALEKKRERRELEYAEARATEAIRRLAINLLRVIAGAGEPWALLKNIDEAHRTYVSYIDAAKNTNLPDKALTEELDLDYLFSPHLDREPVTEEEWRRWAQPVDPYDEYVESNTRAKIELRRAVLRQVASVLSSGETREPHLKAHGGNLDDIIRSILDAKKQYDQQSRRLPAQADPTRQAIAEQKIAELRREQWMQQIRSLPAHQIAALRAVEGRSLDQIDNFTLDVLGRSNLLARPRGSKKKADWQLTEDGRLALDIHKGREC